MLTKITIKAHERKKVYNLLEKFHSNKVYLPTFCVPPLSKWIRRLWVVITLYFLI